MVDFLSQLKNIFSNALNKSRKEPTVSSSRDSGFSFKGALNAARRKAPDDRQNQAIDNLKNGKAFTLSPGEIKSTRYDYNSALSSSLDKIFKGKIKDKLSPEELAEGKEWIKSSKNLSDEEFNSLYALKNKLVDSTAIHSMSYDPETMNLSINFVNGKKTYDYPSVPQDVVMGMLNASSKGRYFHENVADYSIYRGNHSPKTPTQSAAAKKQIQKITEAARQRGQKAPKADSEETRNKHLGGNK